MLAHLKTKYGHSSFRYNQEGILSAAIGGKSVMAVMPTGAGKSLLYQFYATYTKTVSVVVSPLISLMNDQRLSLESIGIKSVCLNSETTSSDLKNLSSAEIIFVTPENLTSEKCQIWNANINVGLLAIDEAHCISQWSHDFRPAYRELSKVRDLRPDLVILAVTATATPRVLAELKRVLRIPKCSVFQEGTHRDNLRISVLPKTSFANHLFQDKTIVYVQTRKICERIFTKLQAKYEGVAMYHGGLAKKEKKWAHGQFALGAIKIIVATISFGMGIDKADIRHVINVGVPTDLETYYQEIGRAGRDGRESRATIFYDHTDFATANSLIATCGCPDQRKVKMQALLQFRKYLGEKTACRQQMIDYYFNHGSISIGEIRDLRGCQLCDNCCGRNKQRGPDLTSQCLVIAKEVAEHRRRKGFSIGITKTVCSLKMNPEFASLSKKKIRHYIEEAISAGYIKQHEVRTKGGRMVFVLEACSVQPQVAHNGSLVTVIRKKLASFRSRKSSCIGMPAEFVLSDSLLEKISRRPDDEKLIDSVASRWRDAVRLLIKSELSRSAFDQKEELRRIYTETSTVTEFAQPIKLANDVLDYIESDDSIPLYLNFFGVDPNMEEKIQSLVLAHPQSSNAFVAIKGGSSIQEYQVRTVKLAHAF